jgi:dihydrodipicolinate synthase/N-acetylneuraminate lyase
VTALPLPLPAGILCAAITPFDRDGDVDEKALVELVEFYSRSGVQGIFGLGTASESMLLESSDRMAIAERLVEAIDGRCGLLLHCGTPDTRSAVALGRHGRSIGIGNVAAIAPYYFAYGAPAVKAHYRELAEALPDSRVYVYDNPERVGYEVGVATVAELVRTVPNIVGVKDTGDSVGRVTRYLALEDPPDVYTGNNELIYATLAVGARGAVSALASAVPELVGAIYGRWQAGEHEEALRLQLLVARLMAVLAGFPYLGAIKALARLRGLPAGHLRRPQVEVDEAGAALLLERVKAIDDLDDWVAPV